MLNVVILPLVAVILMALAGARSALPKAGVELTLTTGGARRLDSVVGAAAELGAAADEDEGAEDDVRTSGTVTAVEPAAATTVELTVTVAGPLDPALVAVHADATTPKPTSRVAMRPALMGVDRPRIRMPTIQCLPRGFFRARSFEVNVLPQQGTSRGSIRCPDLTSMLPVGL